MKNSMQKYLEGLGIFALIACICLFAWYTKNILDNPGMEGFGKETGIYLNAEENGYEIKDYKKIDDPTDGHYMKLKTEAGENFDLYLAREKDVTLFGDSWKEDVFDDIEYYTIYSDAKDNGLIVWKDTGWYFYLQKNVDAKHTFVDENELTDMRLILQSSIWRNG